MTNQSTLTLTKKSSALHFCSPQKPAKKSNQTAIELAAQAHQLHLEIIKLQKAAIQLAKKAGDALHAAKRLVGHGKWKAWVEVHFKASYETAVVYMRISRQWKRLKIDVEAHPDLSLAEALRILKTPHTSQKETTIQDYVNWCRTRLTREIGRFWRDDELVFLATFCRGIAYEDLSDLLHAIRDGIQPLVQETVAAYGKQWEAIKLLRARGLHNDSAEWHQVEVTFAREIAEAFKDRKNLTPFQKKKIEELSRGATRDSNRMDEFREYVQKERAKGKLTFEEKLNALTDEDSRQFEPYMANV